MISEREAAARNRLARIADTTRRPPGADAHDKLEASPVSPVAAPGAVVSS